MRPVTPTWPFTMMRPLTLLDMQEISARVKIAMQSLVLLVLWPLILLDVRSVVLLDMRSVALLRNVIMLRMRRYRPSDKSHRLSDRSHRSPDRSHWASGRSCVEKRRSTQKTEPDCQLLLAKRAKKSSDEPAASESSPALGQDRIPRATHKSLAMSVPSLRIGMQGQKMASSVSSSSREHKSRRSTPDSAESIASENSESDTDRASDDDSKTHNAEWADHAYSASSPIRRKTTVAMSMRKDMRDVPTLPQYQL